MFHFACYFKLYPISLGCVKATYIIIMCNYCTHTERTLMLGREFYQHTLHTLYSDNQTVSMIVCRDIRIIGGNVTSIKVSLAGGWWLVAGGCCSLVESTESFTNQMHSLHSALPLPPCTPCTPHPVTASAASPVVR